MKVNILLLGKDEISDLIFSILSKEYEVYRSHTPEDAKRLMKDTEIDIMLTRFQKGFLSLVSEFIGISPEVFFLLLLEKEQVFEVLTQFQGIVFDYIEIPFTKEEVEHKIKLAVKLCRLRKENKRLTLFNTLTIPAIEILKSRNLYDICKIVLNYIESLLPVVSFIGKIESDESISILTVGKRKTGLREGEKLGFKERHFLEEDERHIKGELLKEFHMTDINNLYTFPLGLRECIGILGIGSLKELDEEDLSFIRQTAGKLSLIIEHIHALEELDRVKKNIKTLGHQEKLRMLGQMVSGIVHDLNNLVFPIIGFTELLLEREFGISKDGRRYLYQILNAAEDIKNITARLRHFYKKEQDEVESIDLNQIVEEVVELTKNKWEKPSIEKGINIEVGLKLSEDIGKIQGVRSEIREALVNLIFNAVDAMPNGGRIDIETKAEEDSIVVKIKDTGIGMEKEVLERCLEPFFTTKGKNGTGLGLSMVYGIMERHGGTVNISSKPGKGTTVTLLFPKRKEKKRLHIEEKKKVFPRPLSILHIEDDAPVARLIKEVLVQENHKVEIAHDGELGIRIFEEKVKEGRPFDLVITDLIMPKVEGRKVASAIKSISPETPVILLTGWDVPEALIGKEIDLVLKKPVFPKELKNAIYKIFERRKLWQNSL